MLQHLAGHSARVYLLDAVVLRLTAWPACRACAAPAEQLHSTISQLHNCIVSAAAPPFCAAETLVNAWELQLVSGEGGQSDRADEAAEAYCGQQVPAVPKPEVAACNSAALHQNGPGSIQHITPAPEMQQVPASAGLAINRLALLKRLSSCCLSLASLAVTLLHC